MSTQTLSPQTPAGSTVALRPVVSRPKSDAGHRFRLFLGYAVAIGLILAITAYGFDYYMLDATLRPFSAKHELLKPSGIIGLKLGFLGLAMFLVIFLYPIRKHWAWLGRQGSSRHWLDFHVLLGLSAPFVIALHSSFKFRGFAGMAFWIMTAVSLSGVVGRYLYGQIPRRVSAAELSLKESRDLQAELTAHLAAQKLISEKDLRPLFRIPTEEQVAHLPILVVLPYMMALDMARPFHVARLRARTLSGTEWLTTLGGLFPSHNAHLENAIELAREQATLSKRVVFYSRAQQFFHLWHIVHKPFSYSFAVLAVIHITVVWLLGYM